MAKRTFSAFLHLIKEYCINKGLPFQEFSEPGGISLEDRGIPGSVSKRALYGRSHVFLACVDDASVFGRGIVASNDGSVFVHGLTYGNYEVAIKRTLDEFVIDRQPDHCLKFAIEEEEYVDEECVLLWGKENFGHWMFEYLTRMAISYHAPEILTKRFIIKASMPKRYLELLYKIGVKEDQIIFVNDTVRVRRLWIPSCVCYRGQYSDSNMYIWPDTVHFLRHKMLGDKALFSTSLKAKKRCVYLSRADASYRKVVNENELVEMLQPYGFQRFLMAEHSIDEQLNIVSDADIILISEGGGSPITMFAPSHAVIIETTIPILGGQWASKVWANILGQRYHRIDGVQVSTSSAIEVIDDDYVLCVQEVQEAIEKALQDPYPGLDFCSEIAGTIFNQKDPPSVSLS